MKRGVVKAPGVNLLLPSDPSRRVLTLDPGTSVEVRDGRSWLRVEVDGVAGLIPAGAVEILSLGPEDPIRPAGALESFSNNDPVRPLEEMEHFVGEGVLAHRDFHGALYRLNDYAGLAQVKVEVTHSFRRRDAWVEGLDIPPSKRSNHLVGHAIDMNLLVDGERLNSVRLNRKHWSELPQAAREWIEMIRLDERLRWGGDFVRPDPVHIDDDLCRRDPDLWFRKLRAIGSNFALPTVSQEERHDFD